MSRLIAMLVHVDDMDKPEELSELWRQPLPRVSLASLNGTRYLDTPEAQVTEVGWALIRPLWVEQWRQYAPQGRPSTRTRCAEQYWVASPFSRWFHPGEFDLS
jgi:hypothetical protein